MVHLFREATFRGPQCNRSQYVAVRLASNAEDKYLGMVFVEGQVDEASPGRQKLRHGT